MVSVQKERSMSGGVAEAVARAVTTSDPQLAEILRAEAQRLRSDTAESRTREAELLFAAAPHQPGYRGQLDMTDLFEDHVTVLDDGERSFAWVYDDDLVTLVDAIAPKQVEGRDFPVGGKVDWWRFNTAVHEELRARFSTPASAKISSIRLKLFEGTARVAATLAEVAAAERVTHLDLCTQERTALPPLISTLPGLVGLQCGESALADLLAGGAPPLESLLVPGARSPERVLEFARGLPKLRHLGFPWRTCSLETLEALAADDVVERLSSLDLFFVNFADRFPFEALLALRGRLGHLQRIVVPGHTLGEEITGRFQDWPAVTFASHDRRELIAFDFETSGWADSTR